MLGRQSRTKALAYRPTVLLPHQLQYLVAKLRVMSVVRGPTRVEVLQACRSLVAISPPEPLRLSITHMQDRKSTRLNSSHLVISYAVFCLKKKKNLTKQSRLYAHI